MAKIVPARQARGSRPVPGRGRAGPIRGRPRCQSLIGHRSREHQTPEADVEGQKTTLAPFDVISVPPKAFHGIVNIGSETALIMTINSGTAGAPIHWDPALLDEIKAAGGPVRATDYPPRGMPAE